MLKLVAYDETKHVYFSFFNPLKVTDELEIHVESLGWVHRDEFGGGELAMERNWYKPSNNAGLKWYFHPTPIRKYVPINKHT